MIDISGIELIEGEVFKEHYTGYMVSNMGRIVGVKNRVLRPARGRDGYCVTSFRGKSRLVHRVVIETFVGDIEDGMTVDHVNGIKYDNRLENLEIVSRSENQKRAYRLGLVVGCSGESNGGATLTEQEVLNIYNMIVDGFTNDDIGMKYKIHPRYVSLIRHGKRWGYLYHSHDVSKLCKDDLISRKERVVTSVMPTKVEFENAIDLLTDLSSGLMMLKEIASKYGLHPTTVSHIKRRKIWKDVWANYDQLVAATTIEKAS